MRGNRIFGILLIAVGLVGFLTVADDLRHVGEFVGVSAITLAGLIFFMASFDLRISNRLPLRWTAVGTLVGIVPGAVLDNMPAGVGLGLVFGALSGILLRRKNKQAQHANSE